MLEILVGIASGVISGIGLGGGAILILILSEFLHVNQHLAQGANLIFFIPTSITAISISLRNKLINVKIGKQIIFFGIIGSVLGAIFSNSINSVSLKKYFGIFLLVIAIYQIYQLIREYILNRKKK